MSKRELLLQTAKEIRVWLQEEFPEHPNLKNQCKRASILIDIHCKHLGLESYVATGYIDKELYDCGHTWNVIELDGELYVLDVTLRQFQDMLQKEVPLVIFGNLDDIYRSYSYLQDNLGRYDYHVDDVRSNLREKLNHYQNNKIGVN